MFLNTSSSLISPSINQPSKFFFSLPYHSTNTSRLEETVPKKRISLRLTLPTNDSSAAAIPALLSAFIRLVDHLVLTAHFRPEVLRKVKAAREDEIRKLQKVADEEKAEERMIKRDEEKKTEREKRLRGMTAEEQKKFLEREREKEGRRAAKKQTKRG